MDAPYYNGEPGARPYDSAWDERAEPDREPARCRDCGALAHEGGAFAPDGFSCADCWRWRAEQGVQFDPRAKAQIEAALRKGAA